MTNINQISGIYYGNQQGEHQFPISLIINYIF